MPVYTSNFFVDILDHLWWVVTMSVPMTMAHQLHVRKLEDLEQTVKIKPAESVPGKSFLYPALTGVNSSDRYVSDRPLHRG